MKKHLEIVGITLVLLVVSLSGCTEESGGNINKFVGTWTSLGNDFYIDIMVLYSDGLAKITNHGSTQDYNHPAAWEVKDDKLVINQTDSELIYTFSYSFSNDETLVLIQEIDDRTFGPYTYKKS